jgi:hypothetical protein
MELCFHDECPICFEQMRERDFFTKLECGHIFCKRCVSQLRDNSRTNGFFLCPYCRRAQYNTKCCLVNYGKMFYYKYQTEFSICVSVCMWVIALLIYIMIILFMAQHSSSQLGVRRRE